MLRVRGLEIPDERPLYAYRLTGEEFLSLEELLKSVLTQFGQRLHCGFSAIELTAQHISGFPALFVLYAAEWWRRRYYGSGFAWEPILHDLGSDTSGWTHLRRSICVTSGLQEWGLSLRDSVGLRYIGTIALQGGLPMRLLSDAKGALGRLLRCVLKEAVKAQVTSLEIQTWVRSLGHYLPRTYRQSEIFVLLADVITTVLTLKVQAQLNQSAGSIEELDKRVPGWRDRFPLSIEDAEAQRLIEQLIKDASAEKELRYPRLFRVERYIERDESGAWHLRSAFPLADGIDSEALDRAFGASANELPRFLHLMLRAADGEQAASLRKLAGQNKYRVERRPWSFSAQQAASEHTVHLAATDGREWASSAPRGEALDVDLPWVFDARDEEPKLLRQGGGAVGTSEALVALPHGWNAVEDDSKGIPLDGLIPHFGRQLFRVRGDVRFSNGELSCRIRTGRADACEESYEWRGQRLWQMAVRPAMAFLGRPRLYRMDESEAANVISGDASWRPLGGASSLLEPLGPTEMWHSVAGEVKGRARMLILPSAAQVRLESGDAISGSIRLVRWGAASLRVDHASITTDLRRDGNDLVADLKMSGNEPAPEWIEVDIHWPHAAHPGRVRLPFPVRGTRIFASTGELAPGTLLAANQLIGVRLLFLSGSPSALPRMCLRFRLAGKPDMIDRQITPPTGSMHVEIRLQDYATEVAHLLANDDRPDAHVEVVAQIGGESHTCLRIARYACRLERSESCVFIGSANNGNIDLKELKELPVLALRLDSPGDEPQSLAPALSEEARGRTWDFCPEDRDPGSWLLYPAADSPLVFRPTLWTVEGEKTNMGKLTMAIGISESEQRDVMLDEVISLLGDDFLDPDWGDVERLAAQLGHLPLVTLDLWRHFARSDKAMAALAIRFSSIPFSLIDRFAAELPFAWETISFVAWREAIQKLRLQCDSRFKEVAEIVFADHLKNRLNEITSRRPALRWSVALARTAAMGEQSQELQFFKRVSGDDISRILFGGDESPWQRMMRTHAEDQWPNFFKMNIAKARQDEVYARFLCPISQGYRDGITNLPILLAAQAASGVTQEWHNNPNLIHALRKHIEFDPDWFEEAYNWSTARCVADGLLKSEFTQ
nr:STY4851/ECs_5259 family protein [Fundidesulfovibrio soli]